MSGGSAETRMSETGGAAEAAKRARAASRKLAVLSEQQRNATLLLAAERLE